MCRNIIFVPLIVSSMVLQKDLEREQVQTDGTVDVGGVGGRLEVCGRKLTRLRASSALGLGRD
jgi:hypothetical protein